MAAVWPPCGRRVAAISPRRLTAASPPPHGHLTATSPDRSADDALREKAAALQAAQRATVALEAAEAARAAAEARAELAEAEARAAVAT